jgi:hypothetical protein
MTQRKDGRWQKSITINGKRVFFYSSEPTERKALKDIEQQLLAYTEKEEKGATFEEVAKDWFALASSDVEPLTAYRYECFLKRAVDWFGDWYIKDITALDIVLPESNLHGLCCRDGWLGDIDPCTAKL